MAGSFYEKPILNYPYEEPVWHHALSKDGEPLDEEPRAGRRKSEFITAVPKARKRKKTNKAEEQGDLGLGIGDGVSDEERGVIVSSNETKKTGSTGFNCLSCRSYTSMAR